MKIEKTVIKRSLMAGTAVTLGVKLLGKKAWNTSFLIGAIAGTIAAFTAPKTPTVFDDRTVTVPPIRQTGTSVMKPVRTGGARPPGDDQSFEKSEYEPTATTETYREGGTGVGPEGFEIRSSF